MVSMDIEDIKRVEFKPGDTLVLRVDRPLRIEEAELMRSQINRLIPGVPVIVLERGMSLEILSGAA